MMRGSTPKRRLPVEAPDVDDLDSRARCTANEHGAHGPTADAIAACPACLPRIYSRDSARHRATPSTLPRVFGGFPYRPYRTTTPRTVTR